MSRRSLLSLTVVVVAGCSQQTSSPIPDVPDHSAHSLLACPHPSAPFPAGSAGWSNLRVHDTGEYPDSSDIGAFRISCGYSHMSYDDPIVYPNQPGAAHLHTFFGNTGTNAYSTHASLRNSGNSTCSGGIANRSAYWIPTLLKDGQPFAPSNAIFYYKSGYAIENASPNVQKIPAGLRMIAGNAGTTSLQEDGNVAWGCADTYVGHFPYIVDCPVGEFVQLMVTFPQCWDGVNLDSADHMSHMAYPQEGACPTTHPVLLPEIMINVRWERTPDLDISSLRLASDCNSELPGGYSVHGDWFEAWEPEIRDTFVENCINPSVDCGAHMLGDGRTLETID